MSTQVAAPSDRQQLLLAALSQADRELSGQELHALLRQGPNRWAWPRCIDTCANFSSGA